MKIKKGMIGIVFALILYLVAGYAFGKYHMPQVSAASDDSNVVNISEITEDTEDGEEVEDSQEEEADWLQDFDNFRIIAHRGAVMAAPENSLEAMEKAVELGYGGVELDPQMSAGGNIYLMHDNDVSRTTDGCGNIRELSNEEIEGLRLDCSEYPAYQGEKMTIPAFEEVVEILSGTDLIMNIDCSKMDWSHEENLNQIMFIVESYDMMDKSFMVISDGEQRRQIHESYPDICISWLYEEGADIESEIAKLKEYPRAMLSVKSEYASQSIINALNEAGVFYQIYNVDSLDRAQELKDMGVPMIETNTVLPANLQE